MYKPVIFHGVDYPSVTKLAEAENISPRLLMKMLAEHGNIETALEKSRMATRDRVTIWGKEYKDLMSAPMIKCKKTPRKKCRFMAEKRKKR